MDTIRQLQARIDKLELELNRIAGMAEQGAKMCKSEFDKKGLLLIAQAADAALNTQPPQVEWTPREGMAVQVKATGERGTIFMHVNRYYQWRVQFTNGELKDHSTDELEPAD